MSDQLHDKNCITSVGCQVTSCTYNTPDRHCSARRIDVENEKAEKKKETFCATFESKDEMRG